jgi:hypothetical protein
MQKLRLFFPGKLPGASGNTKFAKHRLNLVYLTHEKDIFGFLRPFDSYISHGVDKSAASLANRSRYFGGASDGARVVRA